MGAVVVCFTTLVREYRRRRGLRLVWPNAGTTVAARSATRIKMLVKVFDTRLLTFVFISNLAIFNLRIFSLRIFTCRNFDFRISRLLILKPPVVQA